MVLVFDGNVLYPPAMVDSGSFYPRIELRYLSTTDREKDLIQQFNNRTFAQFKDQASAILGVRHYNPKNFIFQKLPVTEHFILDGKRFKDVTRISNGCISQLIANVDIDEIVEMVGKACNIYEGVKLQNLTI